MLQPSPQIVRKLADHNGRGLLSCYVPYARTGREVRQNAIRLKNCQRLLASAVSSGHLDEQTAATATSELMKAAAAAENPRAPRSDGLALFAAGTDSVALACPVPFPTLVTVAPRFYVVPLIPSTAPEPAVLVLALSRHAVRLVDAATSEELPLPAGAPRSLADAVGAEREPPTLQQHSVGAGTMFHGHGEGEDDVLPEIEAYCRRLAHALAGEVERRAATVVLAGDVQITATFRRAADGWSLAPQPIAGSHDRTPAAKLAALALPLANAQRNAKLAELKSLYGSRVAEQRASDDPRDIAAAAHSGRVDTLLLEETAALGEPLQRSAGDSHSIQPEGPFNAAAVATLRCGGDVRIVPAPDMPTPAPQAAIFRF